MNRNILKVFFDFIMTVLLVMIYSISGTGILFHEITGLIIFVLFSIHLFYNRKWISGVTKKILDKTVNNMTKFIYFVDVLLFCAFMTAGLSGILISKELFKFGFVTVWRYVHILSSAISLLSLGIHIGLHWNMIINTIKQYTHLPKIAGRIISIMMLLIVFGAGFYGMTIVKEQTNDIGNHDIRNITVLNLITDVYNINEKREPEQRIDGQNEFRHEQERGKERNRLERNEGNNFNVKSTLILSSGYLSIILLFGIITYFIQKGLKRKNR